MNDAAASWQDANQAALAQALEPVHAALLRLVEPDAPPPCAADRMDDPCAPIAALCTLFGLTTFERDLLLLCAGVELDSRFGDACATAHGDPARSHPSFRLALAALDDPHWSALGSERPLRYWNLIEVLQGNGLTGSALRIDERIVHYLLGIESSDARLRGVVRKVAPAAPPDFLAPVAATVARALLDLRESGQPPRVRVAGGVGSQRISVAAAALRHAGLGMCAVNAADLPETPGERAVLTRAWNREARLTASGLYVAAGDSGATSARALAALIEDADGPLILEESEALPDRAATIRIELPRPDAAQRRILWLDGLGAEAARMNGALDTIADRFATDPATIMATRIAVGRLPPCATRLELHATAWSTCRDQARHALEHVATRIAPRAGWDDLVLPAHQTDTLRQIAAHVRQRTVVHERWGFAAKYTRGLGLTALFTGSSGVGKTMAAEVLARELDLDLFQIDLAATVSKYIGETEKNLKRIFDAAEDSGAILLFDEADALFGKRSEVKDSHDRYANLEISYLLQRMEAYRGLAVLTTNMRHAIDAAFMRRLRFVIEFPFPDIEQRARIWRGVFPPTTPTERLDQDALARLNVPGGTIRNIALHAAYLAADEGRAVGMAHLLAAARTEYAKLEKPLTTTETGGWT